MTTNASALNSGRGNSTWTGFRFISLSAGIFRVRSTFSRPPLNPWNILFRKGNFLISFSFLPQLFGAGMQPPWSFSILNLAPFEMPFTLDVTRITPSPLSPHSNFLSCWPLRHFAKGEILLYGIAYGTMNTQQLLTEADQLPDSFRWVVAHTI